MTYDEYRKAVEDGEIVPAGTVIECRDDGELRTLGQFMAGRIRTNGPRQVCECSKCGRVAIVVCGKCDTELE